MNRPGGALQAFKDLEASFRTVLFHTGSALSSASAEDTGKLLLARSQLEKTLPDSLKRWHSSLDELENYLTKAKSALHRDLAGLRASKIPKAPTTSDPVSPARSLGSDIVMVEAPNEDQPAPALGTSGAMDTVQSASDDSVTASAAQNPSVTQDLESGDAKPEDETQVSNAAQEMEASTVEGVETSQALHIDLNIDLGEFGTSTEAPVPSTEEPPQPSTALEDSADALGNTDVGSLLPGLMDYANNDTPGGSSGGEGTNGLNADDFSADHLFANQPVAGQTDNATDQIDGIDDLFGDTLFGTDNNVTNDAPLDFDTNFSFDDLLNNGIEGGEEAGQATTTSFFGDDFFNLNNENDGNAR